MPFPLDETYDKIWNRGCGPVGTGAGRTDVLLLLVELSLASGCSAGGEWRGVASEWWRGD